MMWVGIALLVMAALSLAFGLYVSFTSEGGSIGQVPVLAHAVAFPLLLVLGYIHLRIAGCGWLKVPTWIVLVAFPLLVFLAGVAIVQVGNLGRSVHRRKM